jgi:hypothetical protein
MTFISEKCEMVDSLKKIKILDTKEGIACLTYQAKRQEALEALE